MISTRDLSELPDIDSLNRLCRSLAMLDAILSPDWESRYYSYNCKWSAGEEMASIRNDSGDDLFLLFDMNGAIMKGFDHESKMTPYRLTPKKIWQGIYDSVPMAFASFMKEPAFNIPDVTFCIWRLNGEAQWNRGKIQFADGKDPDGSACLLALFDNNPESYCNWAEDYYERDVPLDAVQSVYAHTPLMEKLVRELNFDVTLNDLKDDVAEIGYPAKK